MHLFHTEFLRTTCYVPGTVLGYWNTLSKKSLLNLEKAK